MSNRPDSWMPLYIGDYLADTGRLTTEGHGAYLLLIMEYWRSGEPLPNDDEQLASITRLSMDRWNSMRKVLARFFEVDGDVWRHKRIDQEMADAKVRYAKAKARSDAANAAKEAKKAAAKDTSEVTSKETFKASSEEPQPQPQSPIGEESGVVTGAALACSPKAVIKAFDNARAAAYGEEHRRPYPQAKDSVIAQRWLNAGADLDLCAAVFTDVCHSRKARGQPPPGSLAYFDQPIADALADRNRPMPEGSRHEPRTPNSPRGGFTADDALLAGFGAAADDRTRPFPLQ